MPDDAELLRSLRREIGAPSRPTNANRSGVNSGGGGSGSGSGVGYGGGGGGGGGGGASRRMVGSSAGGVSDLSSIGLLRDAEEGRGGQDGVGGVGDDGYDREDGDLDGEEYGLVMFDPVWGKPDYPPGHHTTKCEFCGVMCCPCLMGRDGWRGARNRNVWRRIRKRAAVITSAVDIVTFVLSVIFNRGFQSMWGRRDSNPLLGPSPETLVYLGAKHLTLIQEGQVWRLLTPILLHGGVLHIVMNLTSQFRMGTFLEERWGTRNWLIIYWVGGLGGNLLSCVASPEKVGVGASGAIYAIMGGWLSHVICTWHEDDEFAKGLQLVQVVGYTCVGMAASMAPIVDWAAHFGGLITGIVVGWALFHKPMEDARMLREPLRIKLRRLQGKICTWTVVVAFVIMTYWTFAVATCTIPIRAGSTLLQGPWFVGRAENLSERKGGPFTEYHHGRAIAMRDADDAASSGGESDERSNGAGDNGGGGSGGDMDSKRRRRLELNRKAAKESRRRKKMRIEELGRSVVFLTRENQELREQNEIFRQMVANEVAPDSSNTALSKCQAENAALRMALYETTKQDGDGAGAGKGPGMSIPLSDHPMSGPVPSLAAAVAAVGNPPTSSSSPARSMMTSLSPMPNQSGGDQQSSASSPPTSMMMTSSLQQHLSSSESKNNGGGGSSNDNGNGNGNGNGGGRSSGNLIEAAGAGGNGSVPVSSAGGGPGVRMIAPGGVGTPFLGGGGLGVLASLTSGGRDRDGPSSSQPGGSGGRTLHPKSMSTFVSVSGPGSGGGGGGGAAGRSSGPSHLQSSGYGDSQQGGYGGSGAGQNSGRKLDRGGGGGAGNLDYADMVAQAAANAANVRARSAQQQHSDSGGVGASGGSSAGGSGSRRGGGWPSSWQPGGGGSGGGGGGAGAGGWESTGAGSTTGSVERGL
eukprot:g11959.t1